MLVSEFWPNIATYRNNNSHEKEVKWAKIETFLYENLLLEKQNDGYVL
jgi:hypothetical protein